MPRQHNKASRKERYRRKAHAQNLQSLLALDELHLTCPELSTPQLVRGRFDRFTDSVECKLDLSRCALTSLPECFPPRRLRNSLAFLDLSKCSRLAHLPKNFGELKALKTLDLSDCDSLITLPDAIGGLGALSTLVVQNCRGLEVLPDAIGELRKLKVLGLSRCVKLSALPDTIGGLEALTYLCLFGCQRLAALPDTIGRLKALKTLKCGINSSQFPHDTFMVDLPDTIGGLATLTELMTKYRARIGP